MDDLISRQATIDELMDWVEEHKGESFGGCLFHWTGFKALLECIPSAQPDIIHCGECKYYDDSDGCFFSTATTGADGFCHWAERKEGE